MEFLIDTWSVHRRGLFVFICTKSLRDGSWKEHPIKLDDNLKASIRKVFKTYPDEENHLYFCVNAFTKPRRKPDVAAKTPYAWADMDEAQPDIFSPKPTCVWQTSKGRHSGYWLFKKKNTREVSEAISRTLAYEAGADHSGWDFGQVLRIPGTTNHKYRDAPTVRVLRKFSTGRKYTTKGLLNKIKLKQDVEASDSIAASVYEGFQLDPDEVYSKYSSQIKGETKWLLRETKAKQGHRSENLFKLWHDLYSAGIPLPEIVCLVRNSVWNKHREKGLEAEREQLTREAAKVLEAAVSSESKKPKLARDYAGDDEYFPKLADIEARDVEWFWYPYVARNKITMLEGDPGEGKSYLAMKLLAMHSNGQKFPSERDDRKASVCMYLNLEDGTDDTIKPRLVAMGADEDRIRVLNKALAIDDPDGLDLLEGFIREYEATFIVIDPLNTVLGDTDANKAQDVRRILTPISVMCRELECTMMIVRHFKKAGKGEKSLYRGAGSIDIGAAARSVLQVIPRYDEDEDETKAIVHVKNNLERKGITQLFSIDYETHDIVFQGEDPDFGVAALDKGEDLGKSQLSQCQEQLLEVLGASAKGLTSRKLIDQMMTRNFSESTIVRARSVLVKQKKIEKRRIKDRRKLRAGRSRVQWVLLQAE